MKKLLAVLVMGLIAAPAFAAPVSITNSKHNLSNGTEELCVFCHTPHAAATAVAPLWNRNLVNAASSYTGTGTFSQNGLNDYVGTDVSLCLSCHDGSTPMNSILNVSGTVTNNLVISGSAAIGTDLRNDHPVGFIYADAVADDGAANLRAPVSSWGTAAFKGTLANNTLMQCSSCHDVHDNEFPPFLAKSNSQSNMCLECHIK